MRAIYGTRWWALGDHFTTVVAGSAGRHTNRQFPEVGSLVFCGRLVACSGREGKATMVKTLINAHYARYLLMQPEQAFERLRSEWEVIGVVSALMLTISITFLYDDGIAGIVSRCVSHVPNTPVAAAQLYPDSTYNCAVPQTSSESESAVLGLLMSASSVLLVGAVLYRCDTCVVVHVWSAV